MAKFTVVKQRVFIVEAENDAEANRIVYEDLIAAGTDVTESAFFSAEYTDIYSYGDGAAITSLAMELESEREESRRVSGYAGASNTGEILQ